MPWAMARDGVNECQMIMQASERVSGRQGNGHALWILIGSLIAECSVNDVIAKLGGLFKLGSILHADPTVTLQDQLGMHACYMQIQ